MAGLIDALVQSNLFLFALALSLVLYLVPIWWVLWKSGWRGYLGIQNRWLGGGVELVTALLLSIGMNLLYPQVFMWVFDRARELTGQFKYGIVMGVDWSLYHYLYPLAVLVFLGYLWKNRRRDESES